MARMPQQMYDLRPLKTVELTPPSYVISPQHLIDSCIEVEVKFSGVIPNILQSIDPTNRTDVLREIDRGKKEKHLPRSSQDAIFYLNVHNVKLLTRDDNEDLLLRLPIHHIAALSYVGEDDTHIVAIKYGNYDLSNRQTPGASLDDTALCSIVVLYCRSQTQAEALCSLVDQCFQLIYTDATMKMFDDIVTEGAQGFSAMRPGSVDYSYPDKSRESTPRNGSRHEPPTLGFLSHSSLDLGTSSSATSRSLSRGHSQSSNSELSSAANQLILDYMNKLYNKLNAEELQQFALLVKSWHSELSFPDFINRILELYGPERKYLLVGMQPFIPAKDLAYFEQFIERIGLAGSPPSSTPTGRGFRAPLSSASWLHQSPPTDDADDDFDMLSDIATGSERFGNGKS